MIVINSVINEIAKLREKNTIHIDYKNTNRYRLVLFEKDGTETSYCFGVPIYNYDTGKMVDYRINYQNDVGTIVGTNCEILIDDNITIKNRDGICKFSLMSGKPLYKTPAKCIYENAEVIPTTNGVMCKVNYTDHTHICCSIKTDRVFSNIRANTKYFSFMNTRYVPFVTVSCIGVEDEHGEIISGANVNCIHKSEKEYELVFSAATPFGKKLCFEINAQEPKLFQDTTVESNNPMRNNAFGGIAFIGNSVSYGEMWLYSRPTLPLITELYDIPIKKVMLHFPRHNKTNTEFAVYRTSRRFCSFGSKWENKVDAAEEITNSFINGDFQTMDITKLITDSDTGYLSSSQGFILRPRIKGSSFSVISTGDSFYAPPILEINHE